ncbi:MAG: SDR family NAD(P)-dependent oxidoreductase [Hyphomicrobiales bacterium]|nr:SDR family NAD(P)-dependent oxidoreductase [Hyphomicrobiales bacterium]
MNRILITGASAGIGAALARAAAAPDVDFALWGRDTLRLSSVAGECRARGASAGSRVMDLRDAGAVAAAIVATDEAAPIDLAVFNAGIGGVSLGRDGLEDAAHALDVATVDFVAVVAGATAVARRMAARGRGRIVVVGSVADRLPLPMAPSYAGAKAGLLAFSRSLRGALARRGVGITYVAPGFVKTAMSDSAPGPKPFMLTSDDAARRILAAARAGRAELAFPLPYAILRSLAGFAPRAAAERAASAFAPRR